MILLNRIQHFTLCCVTLIHELAFAYFEHCSPLHFSVLPFAVNESNACCVGEMNNI